MKMTTGKKLGTGIAVVMVLIAVQAAVFMYATRQVAKSVHEHQAARETNGLVTARMLDHFRWADGISTGLFIEGKEFSGKLDATECNLGKWLASYIPLDEELKDHFNATKEPHTALHSTARRIIEEYKAGRKEKAHEIFLRETVPLLNAVQGQLTEMKTIVSKNEDTARKKTETAMRLPVILNLTLTLLILILCFLGGRRIVGNINRLVQGLLDSMRKVSKGDLSIKLEATGIGDELGDSFNEMVSQLKELIKGVTGLSESTRTNAATVAANTSQSSKTMEQIQNSVTQIASATSQVAKSTQEITILTQNTNKAVETGSSNVAKVLESFQNVQGTINSTGQSVNKLNQRSQEISEIVGLITKIADQTNLLALNAAIEAARAGDAGRGFAVVADEVRKLAESSSQSAEKISGIIKEITSDTGGVVAASARSVEETKVVLELMIKMQAGYGEMVEAIKGIGKQVEAIAATSEETAASAEEVTAGTEEQTAAVTEITKIADVLTAGAEKLKAEVNKFRF
ncbi:MAG: hypothetical protein A2X28_04135 [Elusimicrobia bacterium GWA2_56_46]|nr:MAG: hypothetical protein A2X28_04135 [Elusimicrobia bacterium GWA2_56_46]OGR56066.1 MAG: hypothetical protein A2X39_07555 [Elusimicrobia bacterium GWC2_56_31]HBW22899.1 hypothetical protein [Elusimicrobiota bacterium]